MSLIIKPVLLEVLQKSGNVSCVVDAELHLHYCNPAWDEFATKNDGEAAIGSRVIGTHLMEVVPESLRQLYEGLFASAKEKLEMRAIEYECSSDTLFRRFRMEIRPIQSGSGFLVVHALCCEHPHREDGMSFPADPSRYTDSHGLITMCAHCRKTRRAAEPATWDWVPTYLGPGAPRNRISHALCGPCLAYFYPKAYKAAAGSGR